MRGPFHEKASSRKTNLLVASKKSVTTHHTLPFALSVSRWGSVHYEVRPGGAAISAATLGSSSLPSSSGLGPPRSHRTWAVESSRVFVASAIEPAVHVRPRRV
jgi:hypothetical protein